MKIISNDRYKLMKQEKIALEFKIDLLNSTIDKLRFMTEDLQKEILILKGENKGLVLENRKLRKKLKKFGEDNE